MNAQDKLQEQQAIEFGQKLASVLNSYKGSAAEVIVILAHELSYVAMLQHTKKTWLAHTASRIIDGYYSRNPEKEGEVPSAGDDASKDEQIALSKSIVAAMRGYRLGAVLQTGFICLAQLGRFYRLTFEEIKELVIGSIDEAYATHTPKVHPAIVRIINRTIGKSND